jgi:hypothetical protein
MEFDRPPEQAFFRANDLGEPREATHIFAPSTLQLPPSHLTAAQSEVPNNRSGKFHAKISARRNFFVLLCRTVSFENLYHNCNREARTIGRFRNTLDSSISERVNSTF